jgi:large subunit ribosomal protein L25
MADKVLAVQAREKSGSGESRRLRREGLIPAIVYGHQEPVSISVDKHEFERNFKHITENEIVTLKLGNSEYQVLIKDYQANLIKGSIAHLDFYEIEKGKLLKTNCPIKLIGTPEGVRMGGVLESTIHELEVECLPKDIPSTIEIDVTNLTSDHALHVSDLKIPEGVTVLTNAEQVIAAVTHAKAEVETTEEDALGDEAAEETAEESTEE